MKTFVLIPNPTKDTDLAVSAAVVDTLCRQGGVVYAERSIAERLTGVLPYDIFPAAAELILVVGGDGSMIDASRLAVEFDVPLLGINLGKIGYLSEVDPADLSVLASLFAEDYRLEEQMLLEVSGAPEAAETSGRLAINDVIVSHGTPSGMAEFTVSDSSSDTVRYRADGLIVATPVGTTAYSLSAGGPVVARDISAMTLTPVCAHSLFQRSILFSASERLRIENVGDSDLHVLVDGRPHMRLPVGGACYIAAAKRTWKLLKLAERGVFSTLFRKIRTIETI